MSINEKYFIQSNAKNLKYFVPKYKIAKYVSSIKDPFWK